MILFSAWIKWGIAVAGLALAGLIVRQAQDPALVVIIVTVAVGVLIVWIAIEDLKYYTISDSAVLTFAVVAGAYRLSASINFGEPIFVICMSTGFDALVPGGMLLLFREIYYRRNGFDGLGLGDVKLAIAGSMLVGAVGFSWALLSASLMALAVIGLGRLKRIGRPLGNLDKLAFGAFLAPTLWAVWVAEQWPTLVS